MSKLVYTLFLSDACILDSQQSKHSTTVSATDLVFLMLPKYYYEKLGTIHCLSYTAVTLVQGSLICGHYQF